MELQGFPKLLVLELFHDCRQSSEEYMVFQVWDKLDKKEEINERSSHPNPSALLGSNGGAEEAERWRMSGSRLRGNDFPLRTSMSFKTS
jgi:hypothetical protein